MTGEGPAHFPVPAAKQPRYPDCNAAPRLIALYKVRFVFNDHLLCLHFLNLSRVPKNCLHHANAQKDVG
jgi:hypothetical protein